MCRNNQEICKFHLKICKWPHNIIVLYTLFQLCLEATERVSLDYAHQTSHTHLTSLITMLTRLTEVAITFDPSLILLCWKYLAKLVCQSRPHLHDVTQILQSIIEQLCVTVETKTEECLKSEGCSAGGQTFVKLLKLCRFLSTLLFKIVSVSCETPMMGFDAIFGWDSNLNHI